MRYRLLICESGAAGGSNAVNEVDQQPQDPHSGIRCPEHGSVRHADCPGCPPAPLTSNLMTKLRGSWDEALSVVRSAADEIERLSQESTDRLNAGATIARRMYQYRDALLKITAEILLDKYEYRRIAEAALSGEESAHETPAGEPDRLVALENEVAETHDIISECDSEVSAGNLPDRLGDLLEKLKPSAQETRVSVHDAKLDELAKLPQGWDSYGGTPPRADCLAKARQLALLLPPGHWDIVPMSNGGIQIEQHCDGLDIELMIESALPEKANATT